ncbi:hypothetical protein EJ05DRAFT_498189 [Pseudovirgaria hyperparasitica]|uniref:Uncharacterized protein n=1 Tax=Pseudovirgaria hyperparasitica TaxID=470096 RepID=A0A6A6WBZ6_9PEZI|nr:uncharacterized protein EJ05DRAFT_498189 [Pseudovirgaria hyperparasitica]KAF2760223.1 hypothetical protein EJ05DRAFT_498189 [Pseudovirgaria hyperparasitica]
MSSFTPINVTLGKTSFIDSDNRAVEISQPLDHPFLFEPKRSPQHVCETTGSYAAQARRKRIRVHSGSTNPSLQKSPEIKALTKKRATRIPSDNHSQPVTRVFKITKPKKTPNKSSPPLHMYQSTPSLHPLTAPADFNTATELVRFATIPSTLSTKIASRHDLTDAVSLVAPLTSQDALKSQTIHGFTAYDRQRGIGQLVPSSTGCASRTERLILEIVKNSNLSPSSNPNVPVVRSDQKQSTTKAAIVIETVPIATSHEVPDMFTDSDTSSDSDLLAINIMSPSAIDTTSMTNATEENHELHMLIQQSDSFLTSDFLNSGYFEFNELESDEQIENLDPHEPCIEDLTTETGFESDVFDDIDTSLMGYLSLASQPPSSPKGTHEIDWSLQIDAFDDGESDDRKSRNGIIRDSEPSEVLNDELSSLDDRRYEDGIAIMRLPHTEEEASDRLRPFVRPPFPMSVRDRSPIIGLSKDTLSRTCFRVGEAINEGLRAMRCNQGIVIELYARILSASEGDNNAQKFVLCDLFHDRPPYLRSVHDVRKETELSKFNALHLQASAVDQKQMCRCIGKIRVVERQPEFVMSTIWEASWDDVKHVRGIVCSE